MSNLGSWKQYVKATLLLMYCIIWKGTKKSVNSLTNVTIGEEENVSSKARNDYFQAKKPGEG